MSKLITCFGGQQVDPNKTYRILSPDGIDISYSPTWYKGDKVDQAMIDFANRYERQGYYRDNRWEQIPLRSIPGRCKVIELSNEEVAELQTDEL